MPTEPTLEEEWYKMLTEGEPVNRHMYHLFGLLPANPRCKLCAAPFKGIGGILMRMIGREQSKYNPRFCIPCEKFEHPGGAEVVLTMLFADVRGSTTLAEQMSALEFSRLMNRFYTVASNVLIKTDALVDRLIGDEVIGLLHPRLRRKGTSAPRHRSRPGTSQPDRSPQCQRTLAACGGRHPYRSRLRRRGWRHRCAHGFHRTG
jgi:adenylate cyclase